jgi:aconitate hydratase
MPASSPDADEAGVPDETPVVRPASPDTEAPALGDSPGRLPLSPPLAVTLRGVVLARLGDEVGTEALLPAGPMVRRHHTDFAALAGHVLGGVDPGFAARARAHGGGFLVAGAGFGGGGRAPRAALALVALGIRGILARGFAPEFRAELARQGVLTLRAAAADLDGMRAGDELEIPGLPEVLEPNRPAAIRNLTRGAQAIVHHDLTAAEIAMVRAGGRLRMLSPAGVAA